MTETVELAVHSGATAAEAHAAFAQRRYWLDRFAAFGGHTVLQTLDVGADGAVDVSATVHLARAALPGPLRKMVTGGLALRHREVWRAGDDGRVHGEITIGGPGITGGGVGHAVLQAGEDAGSVLRFSATVQVTMPLVGGAVERAIGGQLRRNIPAIQRFTGEWVAARRDR